ncbi:transcription termination factor Rho [Bifidobacterium aquikefiricola]|uniref:Transcription termination factor Rho n=1 Tax=Bifidobacterium aquikefiricola TaxID=3059038 RepID=A0AB39U5T0_9BIFI
MATSQNLDDMKLPELKELAKQMGLRGTSTMRKSKLVETIQAARSGGAAPAGVTVRAPKQAPSLNTSVASTDASQQTPVTQNLPEERSLIRRRTRKSSATKETASREGAQSSDAAAQQGVQQQNRSNDLFDVLGIDNAESGHSEERHDQRDQRDHDKRGADRQDSRRGGHRDSESSTGVALPLRKRSRKHDAVDDNAEQDHENVRDLDDILAALPNRSERSSRRQNDEHGDSQDGNRRSHDRRERNNRNDNADRNERNDRNERSNDRRGRNRRERNRDFESRDEDKRDDARQEELVPVAGIVDVLDSYAFIRTSGYLPGPNDVYVSMGQVKKYSLRKGDAVHGSIRPPHEGERRNQRQKFVPLQSIDTINGMSVEEASSRPHFSKLTPLYPQERLRMETQPNKITGRLIDIVSPIGKGQRGLIVSPPKAGKTITLQNIANSISTNNPEVHLMVVLVDERPEEVTDMERTVQGEVISSTFDRPASDHTTVAELAIERAKRLVELGQDVVVLLDSMTRLARAYNIAAPASGRILSGGVDAQALYPPKKFFGAARNIENGGSLTIISSALVETGSKMDEVIFEEFKGTGNMELRLSRELSEKRMFPAIDINASGTRREELITPPQELSIVYRLRRAFGGMEPEQAYQTLVPRLKKTATNKDFLAALTQNIPQA